MDLVFPNFNTPEILISILGTESIFWPMLSYKTSVFTYYPAEVFAIKDFRYFCIAAPKQQFADPVFCGAFYKVWQAISSRINLSKYLL